MTDFTEEDLQKIKYTMVEEGVDLAGACRIITRLRPAPKFSEGQVVYRSDSTHAYQSYEHSKTFHCRALTIPEMGPLVVKLLNAIADAGSADTPTPIYSAWKELINIHGRSK